MLGAAILHPPHSIVDGMAYYHATHDHNTPFYVAHTLFFFAGTLFVGATVGVARLVHPSYPAGLLGMYSFAHGIYWLWGVGRYRLYGLVCWKPRHGPRCSNYPAIHRWCSGIRSPRGSRSVGLLIAPAWTYRACHRNRPGRRSSRLARMAAARRYVWCRSISRESGLFDPLRSRLAWDIWVYRCEGAEGYEWGANQDSPGVMGH